MSLFISRHERFLEAELLRVREEHAKAMAEQKNTYETLLRNGIEENQRLRDDNERLLRAAVPQVQNVKLATDPVEPPPPITPAKPRTFQEYVNQVKAGWEKEAEKQFIGTPGQPITPEKKLEEKQDAI